MPKGFKDFYYLTWSKLELLKRNIFSIYWTNESSIDIGRKIIKGQFLPQQPLIYDVCYVCPLIVLCFVATLTYKTFVVWWQISFATSSRTNLDQNDNFEKFCHHCTVARKCSKNCLQNVYCFAMQDYFFYRNEDF